jgi:hypothetical protein
VEFSVPYLLGNDAPGLERFSDEMMNDPRCPEQIWVRFNHSFALLLQRRTHEARSGFLAFAGERMDAVQQLLTGYVLDTIAEEEDREIVRQLRDRFTSGRPEEKWKRELERDRANLQVLVLTKLIADATNWVYGREVARAER